MSTLHTLSRNPQWRYDDFDWLFRTPCSRAFWRYVGVIVARAADEIWQMQCGLHKILVSILLLWYLIEYRLYNDTDCACRTLLKEAFEQYKQCHCMFSVWREIVIGIRIVVDCCVCVMAVHFYMYILYEYKLINIHIFYYIYWYVGIHVCIYIVNCTVCFYSLHTPCTFCAIFFTGCTRDSQSYFFVGTNIAKYQGYEDIGTFLHSPFPVHKKSNKYITTLVYTYITVELVVSK